MELVEGHATIADTEAFLANIDTIAEETGAVVQAFDARYVLDRTHLERAVELAGRARDRGTAIASDPGIEMLLYAAGRRQIDEALEMGVSEGECPVVAVAVGDRSRRAAERLEELLEPGETLGAYDPERVRTLFDIGASELAATDGDLAAIVHERVALLVVER